MRMPQLMRREPAPHTGSKRRLVELRADHCRFARATAGASAQNAEQAADRQRAAQLEPTL
jgi:hypothetical protein